MAASHFKLNNLIAIIDYNKFQSINRNEDAITLAPLADKWKAFGWNIIEIDGHNHIDIKDAFTSALQQTEKPSVVIAHTIKGKGISYMENDNLWHYRWAHEGTEYDSAIEELRKLVGFHCPVCQCRFF
jgi:transketolase